MALKSHSLAPTNYVNKSATDTPKKLEHSSKKVVQGIQIQLELANEESIWCETSNNVGYRRYNTHYRYKLDQTLQDIDLSERPIIIHLYPYPYPTH